MKTKKSLLLPLYIIAVLFLWQGCKKSPVFDEPIKPCPAGEVLSLNLRIKMPEMSEPEKDRLRSFLRATEAGQDSYNENKIETISVLFYRRGTLFWQVSTGSGQGIQYSHEQYIIPVPAEKKSAFDGSNAFNVYVVSNLSSITAPLQEADLATLMVSESIKESKPSHFVMVGKLENKLIDMSTVPGKTLGNVDLKRLAAKVRLSQPTVRVDGYEVVGDASVKMRNYRDQSFLMSEQIPPASAIKATEYRLISEPYSSTKLAHFYSYYTSWSLGAKEAPELVLWLKLKKQGEADSAAKNYYYTIPLAAKGEALRSNTLYNTNVTIDILGSPTQDNPEKVTANISVEPWTEHDDTFVLPASDYLTVSEHEIIMKNINAYSFYYLSSKLPINVKIKKVYSRYVDTEDGKEKEKIYHSGDSEYPKVSVDDEKIKIESSIPVNNLPKYIELEITNGVSGLKETVNIVQYPSRYILYTMGTKSSLRDDFDPINEYYLNNKAMYHIVILVPPSNMILGYPNRSNDNKTQNDEETSRMVSPSFELASQLGATPLQRYYSAVNNCKDYTETRKVNGKDITLDDWRLPTEAEIKLVDELQHDPNSAVKSIMTGKFYWDARDENGATRLQGGSGGSSYRAYVRCVRDIKDNTEE